MAELGDDAISQRVEALEGKSHEFGGGKWSRRSSKTLRCLPFYPTRRRASIHQRQYLRVVCRVERNLAGTTRTDRKVRSESWK